MTSKLYVGNLSYGSSQADIENAFLAFNPVQVTLIKDRETGDSKGFAFVTCSDEDSARKAMSAGIELGGRTLKVDIAKPQANNSAPGGRRERFNRGPRDW